jgi:hypothetical protein
MTISTMSITHTRPTLMSPSLPLGGIKKFLQDRPSPKTTEMTYIKPITKCYLGIINKAENIEVCYATITLLFQIQKFDKPVYKSKSEN